MVRISTSAVALIEEDRRKRGFPKSGCVRIFVEDREDGPDIRMAYVDDPESGDRKLEEHDTRFYLAPEVIQPLEGVIIDASKQDPPRIVILRDQPPA